VALPLLRMRRGPGQFLAPIRAETEIVIEGFPRSGNTFVVAAFHQAQRPLDVKIAHHAHVPAQLIEAVRRSVPALALVREPEEAVLSFVVREPGLGVRQVLRGYVRFHEPLLALRRGVVVATLDQATSDLGPVVQRVNRRFGTTFVPFQHTPENVARVMAMIERGDLNTFGSAAMAERGGGRPSGTREPLKDALRTEYRSGSLAGLRRRAERAYATLAAWASGTAGATPTA
jgi:hypothetical protein